METSDGPAALRQLADDIRKNDNLRFTAQLIDNFAHDWQTEREQAAADRAALEQARALLADYEEHCQRTPDGDLILHGNDFAALLAALGGAR